MAPWKWHIHSASQRTQQGHRSWTQSSRESTRARPRVAARTHCRRQGAREGALGQRLARKPQFPRLALLAAAQPPPTPQRRHDASWPTSPLAQQGLTGVWWQLGLGGKEMSRLLVALGRHGYEGYTRGSPGPHWRKGTEDERRLPLCLTRLVGLVSPSFQNIPEAKIQYGLSSCRLE